MLNRIAFAALTAMLASACGIAVAAIYLAADMPAEARIITATGALAGAALGIWCGMFHRT